MKLYHAILNRQWLDIWGLVTSVIKNGLRPHDNGEVGNAIWFSPTTEYVENAKFAVSIEIAEEDFGFGSNEFDITFDGGTAWAHKPIPFEKLTVEKIPVMEMNRGRMYLTNEDLIEFATNPKWRTNTPQTFAELFNYKMTFDDNIIIAELFERYVAPYIGFDFDLSQIQGGKTKVEHLNL